MNYVFLDEIQNVRDFERVVDSLYVRENIDLYITGSNAHLLSGDLATLLSGRYIEIMILPLSIKEFKSINLNLNSMELYHKYIGSSSFPYVTSILEDKKTIEEYLEGLYNSIIIKDVVTRNKITNVLLLQSIIKYIFDNIGNICSTKRISDTLTSSGIKIDSEDCRKI